MHCSTCCRFAQLSQWLAIVTLFSDGLLVLSAPVGFLSVVHRKQCYHELHQFATVQGVVRPLPGTCTSRLRAVTSLVVERLRGEVSRWTGH